MAFGVFFCVFFLLFLVAFLLLSQTNHVAQPWNQIVVDWLETSYSNVGGGVHGEIKQS